MKTDNFTEIAASLREHAYKLTPQRRAVLKVIAASHDHMTPLDIYDRVKVTYPAIGLVTVYRTLEVLASLNLVCRVHTGDSCRSYLLRRPSGHHHHLICQSCGLVIDFTDCDLEVMERRLLKETGFHIKSHLLEFNGQCRNCVEKAAG
jgi:Fur family transcriptional regulator, ferric uptake regulator